MAIANSELKQVVRASSFDLLVRIKISTVVQSLEGYTLWFTCRKCIPKTSVKTDIEAVISKKITVTDNRTFWTVELTPEDTDIDPAKYYYDVQAVTPGGKTYSTKPGYLEIIGDVTRSTA